jgi:hypothetical protein
MSRDPRSADETEQAIREIHEFHELGREMHRRQKKLGDKIIGILVEEMKKNETTLRKARQFADPKTGYRKKHLDNLDRLLRTHKPQFGTAHIVELVTVSWEDGRAELQRECIETNWSKSILKHKISLRRENQVVAGRPRRVEDSKDALIQLSKETDSWKRLVHAMQNKLEPSTNSKPIFEWLPWGCAVKLER